MVSGIAGYLILKPMMSSFVMNLFIMDWIYGQIIMIDGQKYSECLENRLWPILMTTGEMVQCELPPVTGSGVGAEFSISPSAGALPQVSLRETFLGIRMPVVSNRLPDPFESSPRDCLGGGDFHPYLVSSAALRSNEKGRPNMSAVKTMRTVPEKVEGWTVPPPVAEEGMTHFGFHRVPADQKVDLVRNHFDALASKYDMMNTLLSFGIHYLWKRTAIKLLGLREGETVLDICGGTGDLSVLAAKRIGPSGRIVLYDINRAMMEAGRYKSTMPRREAGSSMSRETWSGPPCLPTVLTLRS
jgi:hypothetical protein